MYYYYIEDGKAKISDERPHNVQYITRERAIPVPNKQGYLPILNVDIENVKVWYELEVTEQKLKNDAINELKKHLSDTDYQAIKYAEGQITEEDYAPIKEQRQAWRDEINRLEGEKVESEN